jgi:hypothetical protein
VGVSETCESAICVRVCVCVCLRMCLYVCVCVCARSPARHSTRGRAPFRALYDFIMCVILCAAFSLRTRHPPPPVALNLFGCWPSCSAQPSECVGRMEATLPHGPLHDQARVRRYHRIIAEPVGWAHIWWIGRQDPRGGLFHRGVRVRHGLQVECLLSWSCSNCLHGIRNRNSQGRNRAQHTPHIHACTPTPSRHSSVCGGVQASCRHARCIWLS